MSGRHQSRPVSRNANFDLSQNRMPLTYNRIAAARAEGQHCDCKTGRQEFLPHLSNSSFILTGEP
jgi:hypothetical protein